MVRTFVGRQTFLLLNILFFVVVFFETVCNDMDASCRLMSVLLHSQEGPDKLPDKHSFVYSVALLLALTIKLDFTFF